jgi:hypothetical protein
MANEPIVSDAVLRTITLGKDVFDDITYCLQAWQNAGASAVSFLADPTDPDATLDWVISLLGNLLWAATVFFDPAMIVVEVAAAEVLEVGVSRIGERLKVPQTIASASVATRVASLLGATVGSGAIGQLRQLIAEQGLRSPKGKQFVPVIFGSQNNNFVAEPLS